MELEQVLNNLKQLTPERVSEIQLDVFSDSDLIDDVQAQLVAGFDGDGNPMKEYSPATIIFKEFNGDFISPSGRIALKNKGGFYAGMQVRKAKGKDGFIKEVYSSDEKETELLERYGEPVVELTDDNLQKNIDKTRDKLIEDIQKDIFKT